MKKSIFLGVSLAIIFIVIFNFFSNQKDITVNKETSSPPSNINVNESNHQLLSEKYTIKAKKIENKEKKSDSIEEINNHFNNKIDSLLLMVVVDKDGIDAEGVNWKEVQLELYRRIYDYYLLKNRNENEAKKKVLAHIDLIDRLNKIPKYRDALKRQAKFASILTADFTSHQLTENERKLYIKKVAEVNKELVGYNKSVSEGTINIFGPNYRDELWPLLEDYNDELALKYEHLSYTIATSI